MDDESDQRAGLVPHRRREVLRTARGARLSASRGRPVPLPERYPGDPVEEAEPYARRDYVEPND